MHRSTTHEALDDLDGRQCWSQSLQDVANQLLLRVTTRVHLSQPNVKIIGEFIVQKHVLHTAMPVRNGTLTK